MLGTFGKFGDTEYVGFWRKRRRSSSLFSWPSHLVYGFSIFIHARTKCVQDRIIRAFQPIYPSYIYQFQFRIKEYIRSNNKLVHIFFNDFRKEDYRTKTKSKQKSILYNTIDNMFSQKLYKSTYSCFLLELNS